VASNAPHAGIEGVFYTAQAEALPVQADEYALEDVVTHVLRNASRYRTLGSDITLRVAAEPSHVTLSIFNQGPPIAADQLDRIFEYGVSDAEGPGSSASQRGQGLFVARTYMAKMGGTITAHNAAGGVRFDLRLRRG
jgi:signal transduction histidine kinase